MITEKDLATAFNNAGIDTPEALADVVGGLKKNLELARVDIEIAALNQKSTEALKPINDRRIELQNKRTEITGELKGA